MCRGQLARHSMKHFGLLAALEFISVQWRKDSAHFVVGGAAAVKVAVLGVDLEGIGGPLPFHGRLHVVVAVEGDGRTGGDSA